MAAQSDSLPPSTTTSSRASSTSSSPRRRNRPSSLDLSSIPPLTSPTPPSNTLLFTNLLDPLIFRPDHLQTIESLIHQTAPTHSFSPLKSFRRIIVSFYSEEAAIQVRSIWDGESIAGSKCKVYFGKETKIEDGDGEGKHLELPDAGKLFFISPPPSPPHDWEMRLEEPPNKEVHAEDLASALAKLGGQSGASVQEQQPKSPVSPGGGPEKINTAVAASGGHSPASRGRSRSSTLIFSPVEGGSGPQLPSIAVDDTTQEPEEQELMTEKPIMAHTARPPVELM